MNNMKPTKGYRAFQVINTIIMIFVIFITLYPFVYLVAQSFSSDAAASAGKVTFYPIGFNVNTYKYILRDNQFFRYYGNTIFYTVVGTFISVACTALIKIKQSNYTVSCIHHVFCRWYDSKLYRNHTVVRSSGQYVVNHSSKCNQYIQLTGYEIFLRRTSGRT